jgi:hypothetical protein
MLSLQAASEALPLDCSADCVIKKYHLGQGRASGFATGTSIVQYPGFAACSGTGKYQAEMIEVITQSLKRSALLFATAMTAFWWVVLTLMWPDYPLDAHETAALFVLIAISVHIFLYTSRFFRRYLSLLWRYLYKGNYP